MLNLYKDVDTPVYYKARLFLLRASFFVILETTQLTG